MLFSFPLKLGSVILKHWGTLGSLGGTCENADFLTLILVNESICKNLPQLILVPMVQRSQWGNCFWVFLRHLEYLSVFKTWLALLTSLDPLLLFSPYPPPLPSYFYLRLHSLFTIVPLLEQSSIDDLFVASTFFFFF